MRYLAVDLGEKRTGLASGDDETGLAAPLEVLFIPVSQEDRLLDAIARVCEAQGADGVVLGLPLNMDGTEGPQARRVRAFGAKLTERTGLETLFHDERLTSAEADWSLARSGLTRGQKKNRRDAVAAAAILRSFLTSRGSGASDY